MIEGVTFDQLRAFLAVVDEGSFSAAARRLRRVQSAVSHAMAALEGQLGVALFDRTRRRPALTDRGRLVEAAARRVLLEVNELGRVADGLAGGLEPAVAIVVDAIFPLDALVEVCRGFNRAHEAAQRQTAGGGEDGSAGAALEKLPPAHSHAVDDVPDRFVGRRVARHVIRRMGCTLHAALLLKSLIS